MLGIDTDPGRPDPDGMAWMPIPIRVRQNDADPTRFGSGSTTLISSHVWNKSFGYHNWTLTGFLKCFGSNSIRMHPSFYWMQFTLDILLNSLGTKFPARILNS
jgi:hypothetical protein